MLRLVRDRRGGKMELRREALSGDELETILADWTKWQNIVATAVQYSAAWRVVEPSAGQFLAKLERWLQEHRQPTIASSPHA
ncbi:MAG: hypothetical protein MI861_22530 [Pirellulales bacterium]|nr:hypothetical protein [Pirellulales bacterium]